MKVNLISIRQLYDDDLHVHFDKRRCYVLKEDEDCIITGIKTCNNCCQMNTVVDTLNMNVQIHDMEL